MAVRGPPPAPIGRFRGVPLKSNPSHLWTRPLPLLALLAVVILASGTPAKPEFDLVINGGRVIDPATGADRLASLGISGGRIALIANRRLEGERSLNARGKVVAPGFVDIVSGTHPEGDRYKVLDGVTTCISTHGGPVAIDQWYQNQEKRAPLVNYGTVTGHFELRAEAGAADGNVPATPEQVRKMVQLAEKAHQEGALGIGFGIEYFPGTSGQEVVALAGLAARYRTAIHAHIRLPHLLDPFQGINELVAAAALTGARVQVLHIGSMAIRRQREVLAILDQAQRRGIDIAADIYPYDAWMTRLQSAIFSPGWREKYLLDYSDLVWVATGERLTEQTFQKYREAGGFVACHQIPEAEIELALRHPLVFIASDGYIGEGPASHPRGAGTFSRVLGVYVRDRRVLPLMTALRKMTFEPAQRLAPGAPGLRQRGKLAVGAVADVTVFDPLTVQDQATFQNPRQPSRGIEHVVVNGTVVVEDARLAVQGRGPGRPIRGRGLPHPVEERPSPGGGRPERPDK